MLIFYWVDIVDMCIHSDIIYNEEDYIFVVSKCVDLQYGWICVNHRVIRDGECVFKYITGTL